MAETEIEKLESVGLKDQKSSRRPSTLLFLSMTSPLLLSFRSSAPTPCNLNANGASVMVLFGPKPSTIRRGRTGTGKPSSSGPSSQACAAASRCDLISTWLMVVAAPLLISSVASWSSPVSPGVEKRSVPSISKAFDMAPDGGTLSASAGRPRSWSDSITTSAGLTSSSWKRFTEAAGALGGASAMGGVLDGASATGAEPGGACVPPPQAANSALAKTATAMVSRVVFMLAPVSIGMQRHVLNETNGNHNMWQLQSAGKAANRLPRAPNRVFGLGAIVAGFARSPALPGCLDGPVAFSTNLEDQEPPWLSSKTRNPRPSAACTARTMRWRCPALPWNPPAVKCICAITSVRTGFIVAARCSNPSLKPDFLAVRDQGSSIGPTLLLPP